MNYILDIALKDIQQTLRDKMTFLFLLVMPLLFTVMFGFAFGGLGSSKPDSRLPVGIIDQDNTAISHQLVAALEFSGAIRLDDSITTSGDLEKHVTEKSLAAGIIIQSGYGQSIQFGQPLKVILISDPKTVSGAAAQDPIISAVNRNANAAQMAQIVHQSFGGEEAALVNQALTAWQDQPIHLNMTSSAAQDVKATQTSDSLPLTNTAPGMMLQFGMAGLITAGQVLVQERKSRCMQRLLTTSVARWQILLGHFTAMFLTIIVQFILLITFAQAFLQLDFLRQPMATLVMVLASALFIAALGLLIGALAKGDDQVIIFSLFAMFIFAGLGGAWMPLESTGQTFQAIGRFTPVAWALDGFKNIIVRGLDLTSIWLPAAALLGYALLFFSLAIWKFKYE